MLQPSQPSEVNPGPVLAPLKPVFAHTTMAFVQSLLSVPFGPPFVGAPAAHGTHDNTETQPGNVAQAAWERNLNPKQPLGSDDVNGPRAPVPANVPKLALFCVGPLITRNCVQGEPPDIALLVLKEENVALKHCPAVLGQKVL